MPHEQTSKVTSKPFDADDTRDINNAATAALHHLTISPNDTPPNQVAALIEFVDQSRKKRLNHAKRLDLASELGLLYGNLVCAKSGWTWCIVSEEGEEFLAIGPADRSVILGPVRYIYEQLGLPRREDTTVLLLFNMISGGDLPEAKPSDHYLIG